MLWISIFWHLDAGRILGVRKTFSNCLVYFQFISCVRCVCSCIDDIVKIIKSLDPNKAHGHDEISIWMIKLCASSIAKPLSILFSNYFENQCFSKEWKKANIVPVYKKNDQKLIKNYRPVSLLPVCGKIFEKIIFNSLFKYLEINK